jgi:hypothetical protein
VHQTKVIASNTVVIPPPAVFDGFLDHGTQRSGLLYLGPINRARGVEEASNYAITNHPNQQLTIVGRIESEELAHKLRQRGHRIQGEVPREEVPRLLNHFEHFIYYPQIIDSFCLKIIEAELCGIKIHTNQARIGRYSYPEPTDQLRHRMQKIALSEVIDFIYKSFQ